MRVLHVCLLALAVAHYDFQRTSVHSLTSLNFDQQVTSQRVKVTAVVHFYRTHDDPALAAEFTSLAKDWQGAFAISAVNCDDYEEVCEAQDIRVTPSVKVYPVLPGPVYEYEGERTGKALLAHIAAYIPGKVAEVTRDTEALFKETKPGVPKVMLFTEKAGVPTIYKALSAVLGDTLDFGIVRSDQTEFLSSYNISAFPTLVLLNSDLKAQHYTGEMKYRALFEYLNIYSEVFVTATPLPKESPKPWKSELLPELTQVSSGDLCFGLENVLCAVLILDSKPTDDQISLLQTLQSHLSSDEPIHFMWLNAKLEPAFVTALEGVSAPALVYVKPGNKCKYAKHNGVLSLKAVESALQRIRKEGKFLQVKGKFPKFAYRK